MSSIYTTQAAILGEIQMDDLIALTDDSPALGVVNTTVLNQVIANAGGFIDSKIANIYGDQLPFITVPSSVANMALTIACYRLYRRRSVPDEKNNFTEEYNDVVKFLNEVNKGDAHLNDAPARDYPQGALTSQPTVYGNQPFSGGRIANSM
jgi:phage gp36-like protein